MGNTIIVFILCLSLQNYALVYLLITDAWESLYTYPE